VPAGRRAAGASRASRRPYHSQKTDLASRLARDQPSIRALLNQRETLLDCVRAVHATLEPAVVCQAIVGRLSDWIPLTCWTVVGPELHDQLTMLADKGSLSEMGPACYTVAGWVMEHDDLFCTGDLRRDARVDLDVAAAAIGIPLRGREQIAAALVGLDRGTSTAAPALSAGVKRALEALLTPAGFALDASLLLRRSEALSVTDDLTRLYNSRYLNLALRRESRLAARTGRPLSLLFVDLDGFKSINDSHGHLAGSRALVEAAAVIRGSARETDIAARFGGDEFALILPDTGLPGALAVAERVRDRLARHRFLAGEGLTIHLTASVGVATIPDVATTADELVQAADAAMYRVKDRGKNGIQAAVRADK
jgi:diguanylate cyclase (GGDEF)-like protein